MNEADNIDPVTDRETIARFTDPDEWDTDGVHLKPEVISRQDLTEEVRGWSVQRVECTSKPLAEHAAQKAKKQLSSVGVAVATVSSLRGLVDDQTGQRCFYVLDCPLTDNHPHALVFAPRGVTSKGKVRKLRDRLIAVLTRDTMAATFRMDGLQV